MSRLKDGPEQRRFQRQFNELLRETIDLGVAEDRALKLWGIVLEAWLDREERLMADKSKGRTAASAKVTEDSATRKAAEAAARAKVKPREPEEKKP